MNEPMLYKQLMTSKTILTARPITHQIHTTEIAIRKKSAVCFDFSSYCNDSIDIGSSLYDSFFDFKNWVYTRLPFNCCFFECGMYAEFKFGMLLKEYTYGNGDTNIQTYILAMEQGSIFLYGLISYSFDEKGKQIKWDDGGHDNTGIFYDGYKSEYSFVYNYAILQYCLSWLNAKNIKLQTNDFNPKYQKHARKHLGMDNMKYYTLNVVKPGKQYESLSSGEERQGIMPLHLCRGHLKHFTEEKPLFGKYPGTFFIPAHVRGDRKNGIINKNYKLKVGTTI
ncbi:MAG TPA: hypothetical protein PLP05_00430 [Sedimentisphaerales bacterium]|nr:hypothetical protein [Sedimentisphaerales bacterium]